MREGGVGVGGGWLQNDKKREGGGRGVGGYRNPRRGREGVGGWVATE